MSKIKMDGVTEEFVAPAQATYASATINGDLTSADEISFTVAPGMLVWHATLSDNTQGARGTKRQKVVSDAVNVVAHIGEKAEKHSALTLYGVSTRQIVDGVLAKNNRASVGSLSVVTSGAVTIYARCEGAMPGDELYVYAEPDTEAKYYNISDKFKFPTFVARRPVRWSGAKIVTGIDSTFKRDGNKLTYVATAGSFEAYEDYKAAVGGNARRIAAHVAAEHGAVRGGVLEPGVEAFVTGLHKEVSAGASTPFEALLKDIKQNDVVQLAKYSEVAPLLNTPSSYDADYALLKEAGKRPTSAEKKALKQPRTLGHVGDNLVYDGAVRKGYLHRDLARALSTEGNAVATSTHADHTFSRPTSSAWAPATVVGDDNVTTTFKRRLADGHAELLFGPDIDTRSVLSAAKDGVIKFKEGGTMSEDFFRATDGMPGTVALAVPTEALMAGAATTGTASGGAEDMFPRTQRVGIVISNNKTAGSIRVALSIIPDKRFKKSDGTDKMLNVYKVDSTMPKNAKRAFFPPAIAPQQAVHAQCMVKGEVLAGELLYATAASKNGCRIVTTDHTENIGFFGVAAENVITTEMTRTTAIIAGVVTVYNPNTKEWPVNSMLLAKPVYDEQRVECILRTDDDTWDNTRFVMTTEDEVLGQPSVIGRVLARDDTAAVVLLHRGSAPLPQLNVLSPACTFANIGASTDNLGWTPGAGDTDPGYLQRKQLIQELAASDKFEFAGEVTPKDRADVVDALGNIDLTRVYKYVVAFDQAEADFPKERTPDGSTEYVELNAAADAAQLADYAGSTAVTKKALTTARINVKIWKREIFRIQFGSQTRLVNRDFFTGFGKSEVAGWLQTFDKLRSGIEDQFPSAYSWVLATAKVPDKW